MKQCVWHWNQNAAFTAEMESLESTTKQLSDRISELASELEGRCQTI